MGLQTIIDLLIPLIEQAAKLSFSLVTLIQDYKGISDEDKTALIARVRDAQSKLQKWE